MHYQAVERNGSIAIEQFAPGPDSIVYPPARDFSCYVIVDNSQGSSDLQLRSHAAEHGHFVVPPPERIGPGDKGWLWLQDFPGVDGSGASVTYSREGAGDLTLTFACPTLGSNTCSGANFFAKTSTNPWGPENHVEKMGHPFFVRFVI